MRNNIFSSEQRLALVTVVSFGCLLANSGQADEVHAINTIVEGSLCVSQGGRCVNPEVYLALEFNSDIKIEDNFPAIFFKDTSIGARDWQIQVDYGQNGTPAQAFSIGHNNDGSTTDDAYPFVIENGTADNLLYLDSLERIGINTNAPAYTVDAVGNRMRIVNGPKSLQMRVDGAWTDLEAQGTHLVVHSASPGFDLLLNPFGTNDGNVGVGTSSPETKLHLQTSNGDTQLLVREANGTAVRRELFRVENNGDPSFVFQDTSSGRATEFRLFGGADDFVVNHLGTGSAELKLDRSGNLTITGSLTQASSIASKTAILAVIPVDVLSKVQALPISSWQYRADEPEVRHLGPMAQDFHAAFGLGENDTGIAPADMAGVALAAIQAQQQQIQLQQQQIQLQQQRLTEKDTQITDLQLRLAAIEARLSE